MMPERARDKMSGSFGRAWDFPQSRQESVEFLVRRLFADHQRLVQQGEQRLRQAERRLSESRAMKLAVWRKLGEMGVQSKEQEVRCVHVEFDTSTDEEAEA